VFNTTREYYCWQVLYLHEYESHHPKLYEFKMGEEAIIHLNNVSLFKMASAGMLRRVALVRTNVSEELSASIIRVTRIGELGTTAVTSNRRAL
jgi:hypothetical protein